MFIPEPSSHAPEGLGTAAPEEICAKIHPMVQSVSFPRPVLLTLAVVLAAAAILYSAVWMYAVRWEPEALLGASFSARSFRITGVAEGGAAEQAGLAEGDAIVAVNGGSLETPIPFFDTVGRGQAGDVVSVTVERPGEPAPLTLDATLGPAPALPGEERPLALTAEATQNVVDAARQADRCLMVGMSHRFRPDAGALAAFVAGGELGSVFAVRGSSLTRRLPFGRITWRQQPEQAGGGALMDLGVQALDLGFWLVGHPKITRVSAAMKGGESGVEASATVLAVSEDGIAFDIEVSWGLFAEADQHFARVMGTEGSGSLPPLQVHKQLGGRPMNVTPRQPKTRGGESLFTNAYRRLLDEFVRAMLGRCELPLPTEQVELMRVVEAAYASAREQREVTL